MTTNRTPTRIRAHRLAGVALSGLVLLSAACGDDEDGASAETGSQDAALAAETCDAFVELGALLTAVPEDPAEMDAFAAELEATVERLAADLPEDLQAAGQALVDAGDDLDALFGPEGIEAQAAIGEAVHEGCDAEAAIDVVGTEYAFDGLPDELPAGRISVAFRNDGAEEHEMIVLRRNDGSDATFEELAEAGPDALLAEATFEGVVFASPGQTGYAAFDLEPGTYFMVCTIPVGGGDEGEPHAAHGMHQTVVVA